MSLTYIRGDATQPQAIGCKMLVHVCNDVGAWGRGFVVALSQRYKEPEHCYKAWAKGDGSVPFALGQVQFVPVSVEVVVANLIGQHGVARRIGNKDRPPIRYEAIRAGLARVRAEAYTREASVHMPRIGSGLAGGNWEEIERIVQEELVNYGVSVTVYDLP